MGPDELSDLAADPATAKAARVYDELQRRLVRANAMDFDDLLGRAWELLSRDERVLAGCQERFRADLGRRVPGHEPRPVPRVTNLLASAHRNLMVVGDDDPASIYYSWRGADIENILDFRSDYPDARVVKLEQNYRSTGHILGAANAVVSNNSRREPRRLFTTAGDGEPVRVYQAADERDEGRWVAAEIEKLHAAGTSYDDVAVALPHERPVARGRGHVPARGRPLQRPWAARASSTAPRCAT